MNAIRQQPTITIETALHAVHTAMTEGTTAGIAVCVAIVDPGMNLIAFARGDGAMPHSAETCRRKANTSASTGRPSGWMSDELAAMLPAATGNLLTNITGGLPLRFDGELAGAIGVAGGTPAQDAEVAAATVRAIGADPTQEGT